MDNIRKGNRLNEHAGVNFVISVLRRIISVVHHDKNSRRESERNVTTVSR